MLQETLIQQVNGTWKDILSKELTKDYFNALLSFVENEYLHNKVFPAPSTIFKALSLTPFEKVKVVICGQDPYHGIGQANGLAFSVQPTIKIPPSLKNIIKELKSDVNISEPLHGDLTNWAKQGVLLLNNTLTVAQSNPLSHLNKGWEILTDQLVQQINKDNNNVVFIAWGKKAESKIKFIDTQKHLVLKAPHPSPFSAYTGFYGCKHFSKTNKYLVSKNINPINWEII